MQELFDVGGRRALVTGGSRGIGLMIARGLVRGGARVLIASRKQADLESAAAELSAEGECEAIVADLSTPEGARARWPGPRASASQSFTSWSITPAPPGARRWSSSRPPAGTAS